MNEAVPKILAGTCAASGVTLFGQLLPAPLGDCECVTYSSFVFLTAVFLCIAAQDFPQLFHEMNNIAVFVLQFLLTLFLLEISKFLWDRVECVVTYVLPAHCRRYLMADKDCGFFWIFCSFDDAIFFTLLIHLLAASVLFAVLRLYLHLPWFLDYF